MVNVIVDTIVLILLASAALGCLAFMIYCALCIDHNSRMFIEDLDEHDKSLILDYKSVSPFKWRRK